MTTSFVLNGTPVEVGEHPHLLSALREELGVTSPKDGCAPSGQCGCCTVLLDGKAVVSCQVSLERAAGKAVTTVEGMAASERDRYARVFAERGALQCGFCIPGILLRTKSLIDKKGSALTADDAARHLGAHLCRCTGYVKILDAVTALAAGAEGNVAVDESNGAAASGGIGSRTVRYQGEDLVLGDKPYVDDIRLPGMLHAALRLADHARADVLSIDPSAALAVPGVTAVLTAADIPGDLRVGIIYKDWPVMIPVGGRTSYLGDVLAVVVASDRATALAAAPLVSVEYDVRPPIVDAVAAVTPGAEDAVWQLDGNVLSRSAYARGHVDEALAESAHTLHEVFQTQRVEHAYLEPESTVADLHGRRGPRVVRRPGRVGRPRPDRLRTRPADNGRHRRTGRQRRRLRGQGGHEQPGPHRPGGVEAGPAGQVHPDPRAVAPHAPQAPPDPHRGVGRVLPSGSLTALRARMVGDSGPYASVGMKVLERAAGHACGPYVIPNVDVEAIAARTNNPVCGAFRGFGANQAQFAMEGVMDRLAEMCGLSGWEIRSPQHRRPRVRCGVRARSWTTVAAAPGAASTPSAGVRRARGPPASPSGVGLGIKNSGLGNGFKEIARAVVRFEHDGTVEVRHCWTEMGQGVHTVARAGGRRGAGRRPVAGARHRRHHQRARRRSDHRVAAAR